MSIKGGRLLADLLPTNQLPSPVRHEFSRHINRVERPLQFLNRRRMRLTWRAARHLVDAMLFNDAELTIDLTNFRELSISETLLLFDAAPGQLANVHAFGVLNVLGVS